MTIKETRRKYNQHVANECPDLQNFERNALRQLEWHVLDTLKNQFGSGVSYVWSPGPCGDPLRILEGFAADLVVEVPTDEPCCYKTYEGFAWTAMDGTIHMELEHREDVRF